MPRADIFHPGWGLLVLRASRELLLGVILARPVGPARETGRYRPTEGFSDSSMDCEYSSAQLSAADRPDGNGPVQAPRRIPSGPPNRLSFEFVGLRRCGDIEQASMDRRGTTASKSGGAGSTRGNYAL